MSERLKSDGPALTAARGRLLLVLLFSLTAETAHADMRCCMAEPAKITPNGFFKYTGIPFRVAYPVIPLRAFAQTGPTAPEQPAAPTLNAPNPPNLEPGPRTDFTPSGLQAPGAPAR